MDRPGVKSFFSSDFTIRLTVAASLAACHSTGLVSPDNSIATWIDSLCESKPTKVIPSLIDRLLSYAALMPLTGALTACGKSDVLAHH